MKQYKKLKLHTPDFTRQNIERLAELFPNCVTETRQADGSLKKAIDYDQLRQELSADIVEGPQERYQLNWPGKREALATANAPVNLTLRPCREESVDFDSTQNLFIEGDNLEALKLLQETYLGKVKMIYIDPPYNTGNDFIYNDRFTAEDEQYQLDAGLRDEEGNRMLHSEQYQKNQDSNGRFHSDWLSMMYPRLKLARNLLRDDGVIFISIDDSEISNIRRICDEVFGEKNFIANVIWQKRTSPDARYNLGAAHDYVLVFTKNIDSPNKILNKLQISDDRKAQYKNPDGDPRGVWASVDLTGQTGHATPSQFYEIQTPSGMKYSPPDGRCWALAQATFDELNKDSRIWFGSSGDSRPRLKKYLSESGGMNSWTWWPNTEVGHNQEATKEAKSFFGSGNIFDNPKPTRLLKRILSLATDNTDIIIDFFSGSGTTAQAVMELNSENGGNRKFIMVQLPESCDKKSEAYKAGYLTIAEIGKERIRRAGQKIKADNVGKEDIGTENSSCISSTSAIPGGRQLDIGFRVLKVDSSNMNDVYYTPDAINQNDLFKFVDNVRDDRTEEDLLFQVLLDWGVNLSLPITRETIIGKSVLFIDGNALAACFDKNGGINEDFVKQLAARQPLRVVFRDAGFADSSVKINVEQIFKQLSPHTEIKVI